MPVYYAIIGIHIIFYLQALTKNRPSCGRPTIAQSNIFYYKTGRFVIPLIITVAERSLYKEYFSLARAVSANIPIYT